MFLYFLPELRLPPFCLNFLLFFGGGGQCPLPPPPASCEAAPMENGVGVFPLPRTVGRFFFFFFLFVYENGILNMKTDIDQCPTPPFLNFFCSNQWGRPGGRPFWPIAMQVTVVQPRFAKRGPKRGLRERSNRAGEGVGGGFPPPTVKRFF